MWDSLMRAASAVKLFPDLRDQQIILKQVLIEWPQVGQTNDMT